MKNQSAPVYRCPRDDYYPLQKYQACPKCHLWPIIPTWSLVVVWLVLISIPSLLLARILLRNSGAAPFTAPATQTQVVQAPTRPTSASETPAIPEAAASPARALTGTLTPTFEPGATFSPPPTASPTPTLTLTPTPVVPPACTRDGASIQSPLDGMTQLCVTRGDFQMGSDPKLDPLAVSDELPLHTVTVKAFWIDQTEVTNQQYALCVQAGQCTPPASENPTDPVFFGNPEYDQYPVTYVDWDQANTYCRWANRSLPTEAEWEKAARGTKSQIYPWGNTPPNPDILNYKLQRDGIVPVGSYPAGKSTYGALDMAGNVMEWVWDLYQNDYYKTQSKWVDPTGPTASDYGLTKGGAWISHGDYRVRSAARYGYQRSTRLGANGFRCAVDAGQP